MEFDVEIVLRETNHAVTERIEHGTEPRAWRELDVETVLKQILLAIDRVKNPSAGAPARGAPRLQLDRRADGGRRRHRHRDPDGRRGRRAVRDRVRSASTR